MEDKIIELNQLVSEISCSKNIAKCINGDVYFYNKYRVYVGNGELMNICYLDGEYDECLCDEYKICSINYLDELLKTVNINMIMEINCENIERDGINIVFHNEICGMKFKELKQIEPHSLSKYLNLEKPHELSNICILTDEQIQIYKNINKNLNSDIDINEKIENMENNIRELQKKYNSLEGFKILDDKNTAKSTKTKKLTEMEKIIFAIKNDIVYNCENKLCISDLSMYQIRSSLIESGNKLILIKKPNFKNRCKHVTCGVYKGYLNTYKNHTFDELATIVRKFELEHDDPFVERILDYHVIFMSQNSLCDLDKV